MKGYKGFDKDFKCRKVGAMWKKGQTNDFRQSV